MSAVCLKLAALLSLSCSALGDSGAGGVLWKRPGDLVTVRCRPDGPVRESLHLYQGLLQKRELAYVDSEGSNVARELRGRLRVQGTFPNVDMVVANLTTADTHTYWCVYSEFGPTGNINKTGLGSVLLVVTEDSAANAAQACQGRHQSLVLVSVVISAVVLLGFILGALVWILLKTKTRRIGEKLRRPTNNDVYEEMRCTIRR